MPGKGRGPRKARADAMVGGLASRRGPPYSAFGPFLLRAKAAIAKAKTTATRIAT